MKALVLWIIHLLFWIPIRTRELYEGRSPIEEVPYGNGIGIDDRESLRRVVILGWVYVILFTVIWLLPEIHKLSISLLWVLGFLYFFTGLVYAYFNKNNE